MDAILSFLFSNSPVIGVGAIMVSMGISLTVSDFARVLRHPRAIILGIAGQTVLLPAVAVIIALVLSLPSHIALGLIIIAACPGGATSNAFSSMAKGDGALSISLTAVSSILAFLTVPFIINSGASIIGGSGGEVTLNFVDAATRIFLNTVAPLSLGMAFRRVMPGLSVHFIKPLLLFGMMVLVLPVFVFIQQFKSLLGGPDTLAATSSVLLNFVMMGVGFIVGVIGGLPAKQARTLSIEVGIQNYGLVLIIIVTFLQDFSLLLPAMFYLPSMYLTGILMVWIGDRYDHLFSKADTDRTVEQLAD
ncbi:MAG: bile acid:sodium symporter [Pseudomonadota bacterium]